MTADRILLWRHGQTDYNLAWRIQGSTDIPLNAVGLGQARYVAPHIAAAGPAHFVASPLQRAYATALEAARLVDREVATDARLQERCFGQFEGLTRTEIAERYPREFAQWRAGEEPVGVGVETKEHVGARVAAAITEASEGMDGGLLVVTAHGAAITCGLGVLLGCGADWQGLGGLDNCHWAMLQRRKNGNVQWRRTGFNRFLADEHDPVKNFEVEGPEG